MMANDFYYIADITSARNRSEAMIIMEAMVDLCESFDFLAESLFSKLLQNQLAWGFSVRYYSMPIYSVFSRRGHETAAEKFESPVRRPFGK